MKAALRKQRYLIEYTICSLLRRPGKNLGLILVYALIVFLLASVTLFTHALRTEARMILSGSPEIILQKMTAGRHDLIPAAYLETIGRVRGISSKRGRLWGYFYDPAVKANYTLMVPKDHRLDGNSVTIGAGIARTRGISIGDVLTLRAADGRSFPFEISGILPAESELVSADLILLSESRFRDFFGFPEDRFTDLVFEVRNPRELRTIAEKLSLKLPDTRPILRDEILRTYDSLFGWRQGIVFVLLAGALLAFVIFAWDRASGLSAEERREIGILKAIGWETADVIRMKFWEGSLISFSAFLVGFLAAYVHVFFASAILFEHVLKGWAILYPEFQLTPFIDGLQLVTLMSFSVFPYTVATIIPIWRAAIADPDAVMR